MKILLIEWKGYGFQDIKEAFRGLGHELASVPYDTSDDYYDSPVFEKSLADAIESFRPDFLFTFNFYPVISKVAEQYSQKAVYWVYDSPHYMLFSPRTEYPGNHIFLFDRAFCTQLRNLGKERVSYLPLAANAKRLRSYDDEKYFRTTPWYNRTDLAFVGSLYSSDKGRTYPAVAPLLGDRLRGYLEGIMDAQHLIYGCNFIEDCLDPEVIRELEEKVCLNYHSDGEESKAYLYAQCLINRELTARERSEYLTLLGAHHPYDLYTTDPSFTTPGCVNHGTIDFYHGAPHVYRKARINYNFTLRSILSGIPLRCFEILGSGGFLLSNYQGDFEDCYNAFEDYVWFSDENDLMNKTDYYLSHEKERAEIAENGYRKTLAEHSFEKRITESIIPALFG